MLKIKLRVMLDYYLGKMSIIDSIDEQIEFLKSFEDVDKDEIYSLKNDKKLSRRKFYLRNGFLSSNKYIVDNNVKYEMLTTNKDYYITDETLRKRYINMTKSKFIKLLIRKKFNVDNIVLGCDNNE